MTFEKAQLSLEFLKHFYLSDIDDQLKKEAVRNLLEFLQEKKP